MAASDELTRRRFLLATGGVGSAVALAGCSSQNDPSNDDGGTADTGTESETETTESTSGNGDTSSTQTLNLLSSGVRTLDPIPATTSSDAEVGVNIFDGLITYPNGEPNVEALLATDYEISDDGTTYQFSLKDGVTFHNDATFSAADVVYSWERLAASPNSGRDYYLLSTLGVAHETDDEGNYVPGSMAVEALDESTLEVTLTEPFHAALQVMAYSAFAVLPEGVVGDIDGYEGEMSQEEFATNPVGCGPFEFESYTSGTSVSVTRFDGYHGTKASVAGVKWSVIPDPSAQYNAAMNENLDAFDIPTSQYDSAKISVSETDDRGREVGTYGPARNGKTLNYLRVPTISSSYIGFNTEIIPKPVRQAVAYVANQQLFNERVFKSRNVAATHFTPPTIYPGGVAEYEKHAENYPYGVDETRLDEARAVLEEAGYSDSNRFEFTLSTYTAEWESVAKILRDQLTSVYVDVVIKRTDFSVLANQLVNGNAEAYTLGWSFDWPTPDNFLQLLYPPKTDTSSGNNVGFTNWGGTDAATRATEAWDEKVASNPGPSDAAEQARNEAYVVIEEANWEDMVQLPVYHESEELFSYDRLSFPKFGSGGSYRQKKNEFTLSEEQ
ncbi:peptide/nickel transport system substrate-binding protein [Halogranum rubrum]|uniref:Peptide/nickel transport system substrate-binding protein n=1 Tax=Halogranum rubrum TaxID=553466 RepID=A0A1I4GXQ7_9EURY|nr:ABC transporter substrate-binding protein [Halogranum rubrum]SFL34852.1 peptide/nickel transport system substrate-binding protein [Halogranum rubrum]